MDPITGANRLGGVTDADAILKDRRILGNSGERHLVAIGNGLGQADRRRLAGANHLDNSGRRAVFEHNGGIVSRVDLKTGKHKRPLSLPQCVVMLGFMLAEFPHFTVTLANVQRAGKMGVDFYIGTFWPRCVALARNRSLRLQSCGQCRAPE